MIKTNIINVTMTDTQLDDVARCSHRMTQYASENEGLLIVAINSNEDVQVRLNLDKSCVHPAVQKRSAANSS
jgi:hypothetical protein